MKLLKDLIVLAILFVAVVFPFRLFIDYVAPFAVNVARTL